MNPRSRVCNAAQGFDGVLVAGMGGKQTQQRGVRWTLYCLEVTAPNYTSPLHRASVFFDLMSNFTPTTPQPPSKTIGS